MPCSQMMSMNIKPPRLSEARKLAMLPALKARMRNRARPEHRMGDLGLDDPERDQDRQAAEDLGQHDRAGPAHGVAAVGQQAVGDADQDEDEPDGEGDVAQPVDLRRRAHAAVLELQVRPHGAHHADGHRDEEDEAPLDRGEQAAEDQADEGARHRGHVVDAEAEPTLVGREGVGDDRRRVGEEHGATDALADAHHDQPDGTGRTR